MSACWAFGFPCDWLCLVKEWDGEVLKGETGQGGMWHHLVGWKQVEQIWIWNMKNMNMKWPGWLRTGWKQVKQIWKLCTFVLPGDTHKWVTMIVKVTLLRSISLVKSIFLKQHSQCVVFARTILKINWKSNLTADCPVPVYRHSALDWRRGLVASANTTKRQALTWASDHQSFKLVSGLNDNATTMWWRISVVEEQIDFIWCRRYHVGTKLVLHEVAWPCIVLSAENEHQVYFRLNNTLPILFFSALQFNKPTSSQKSWLAKNTCFVVCALSCWFLLRFRCTGCCFVTIVKNINICVHQTVKNMNALYTNMCKL